MSRRRAGLNLLEVIVIIAVIAVLIGVLLPALAPRRHHGGRQTKCSSQVRGIIQGLCVWAGNNTDRYPMPSLIDLEDTTVAESRQAKDTTANILSLLVYNGISPVEMFVSPGEVNPLIRPMQNYQLKNPSTAKDPAKAFWDPGFKSDLSGQEGNNSYAHAFPFLPRYRENNQRIGGGLWGSTFVATEAVFGNRGPQIDALSYGSGGQIKPTFTLGENSNTFQIHGSRVKWEGNVGFNDNHVDFWADLTSDTQTYTTNAGARQRDVLFYDEPDAAGAIGADNAYLSIFTKAGPTKADFVSIWD